MRNRRLAIAGLALAATLGLTGCGPLAGPAQPGAGAPAAAEQADPAAELTAAARKLGEQSLRFDMEMVGAITASGAADPQAGNAQMSMNLGALGTGNKIELRKVGQDIYLKFGGAAGQLLGGGSSKPWMHVDASKLPAGSSFAMMSPEDPAGTKAMIAAMTKVERVGTHGFKGTLDLTKSPTYNKKGLLGALGATRVPFTATTDDQGRLVELTLDMSSMAAATSASTAPGGTRMKTTYSGFGTKVSVDAPPAAEVGELPAGLAGVLNA